MRTALIAVGIGVAMEAALIPALFVGGLGPCGPSSPLSALVLFIHAPGFWLTKRMGLGDQESLILVPTVYAALWSGIALLIVGARSRHEE